LIAKSVLVSIIIAGGFLYAFRAFAGNIESMIVILMIVALLLDPIISKKPHRRARSLVIASILASSSFGVALAFAPYVVQASVLLILGLLIGRSLYVLIEKQRIAPDDAWWLPTFAAIVAGIMSISIVGLAFIGESIARALGPGGAQWFEPSRPWLSLTGPMLYYLGIALPQIRVLEKRTLIISSVVFVIIVGAVIIGVHVTGIV
jgi:hypothetical protein